MTNAKSATVGGTQSTLSHGTGVILTWFGSHRRLFVIAGLVVAVVLALSIVIQLLYPASRALPFMHLGGLNIGGKDHQAIIAQLDEFANTGEVRLSTPSRAWTAQWSELGVSIDREATANIALQYEWWERLLPFSSLLRILQSRETAMIALVDPDRLRAFAEKVVNEDSLAARNAIVVIKDGQVMIDEAKSGYRYTIDEVERQIQALPIVSGAVVELVPEAVPPTRTQAELQAIAKEAEVLLAKPLTLIVADKQFRPDRAVIGQWLTIQEEPGGQLQVIVNFEALRSYLAQIDKEIMIAPGTATVTLIDGQEVSRTPAAAGRSVAVDASLLAIEAELRTTTPPQPITLPIATVPANVEYVRTYSQQNGGLQALIQDWEATNYGDYGIIVRELGGAQRYAEWQPDKRFVTASTYKMFLAYIVLSKVERGELSLGQLTDMGWTVDACLREMIINSTNPCAISIQNLIGWEETDRLVHDAGFTATFLNNKNGGDKYSTVRDETNFLLRVYAHSLMNDVHSEFLLNMLKRQVWRAGIPSGVPRGTVVADKVGLYGAWVHDVAIVWGPKSTYILGIMSRGGSDPQFADLSRRVYNFFNH